MGLKPALVTRLVEVGTPAADRVSWYGRARGDAVPSIVLMLVTPGEEWTHEGPDGLNRPRVRFDCYAASDVETATLAAAVKAEMVHSRTVAGVTFHPAMLDAERDFDAGEEDGGAPLFRTQLEFLFFYEEN